MKKALTLLIVSLLLISLLCFQPHTVQAQQQLTDEFSSTTLGSQWSFIDPDGNSSVSLTASPGWLRITTISPPGRDLVGSLVNAPRVMAVSSLSSDFTVETKVSASMTQNDEGAGILIWKDSSQFLRFERMSRTIGNPVQQQIMFSVNGGSYKNVILTSSINPTYLKLVKSGYVFAAYYSSDGSSWTNLGNLTFSVSDPVSIGLDAINVYHNDTFVANFDYFRFTPTATPTPSPSPTPKPTPTPTPTPTPYMPEPTPTPTSTPTPTPTPRQVGSV